MEAQIENIQRVRQEVHLNEWYIDMVGIDENSIGLYYIIMYVVLIVSFIIHQLLLFLFHLILYTCIHMYITVKNSGTSVLSC